MSQRDLKNNLAVVQLQGPADTSDTLTKGKVLDTRGFNAVSMLFLIGAITGGDGSNYGTPKLQESDTTNDADFTDVAAADLVGTFAIAAANTAQQVGYRGQKRYIRPVMTFTGTAITVFNQSMVGLMGRASELPVSAPAAITAT